jgi:hypothetical protein
VSFGAGSGGISGNTVGCSATTGILVSTELSAVDVTNSKAGNDATALATSPIDATASVVVGPALAGGSEGPGTASPLVTAPFSTVAVVPMKGTKVGSQHSIDSPGGSTVSLTSAEFAKELLLISSLSTVRVTPRAGNVTTWPTVAVRISFLEPPAGVGSLSIVGPFIPIILSNSVVAVSPSDVLVFVEVGLMLIVEVFVPKVVKPPVDVFPFNLAWEDESAASVETFPIRKSRITGTYQY